MSTVGEFVEGIRRGDRVMLGRAITLVESARPDHREQAEALLDACIPHTGDSIRIGITGSPGVGKSTFIEAFGSALIEEHERRVAVLAVDPSSQISGGSILGDKTRMQRLSTSEHAFIRPSPSGRTAGGVTGRTREVIILCEAAGYDTILVETVGVGQSETAVRSTVDFFLLLTLAGAGDELQGIKRGIVEMADGIAVTKADGSNLEATDRARMQVSSALRLFPASESGWKPKVRTCSSVSGDGLATIWSDIVAYWNATRQSGFFDRQRQSQARSWLRASLEQRLLDLLREDDDVARMLETYEQQVAAREISASAAASAIIEAFLRPSRLPES